jgi:hypothetical protein
VTSNYHTKPAPHSQQIDDHLGIVAVVFLSSGYKSGCVRAMQCSGFYFLFIVSFLFNKICVNVIKLVATGSMLNRFATSCPMQLDCLRSVLSGLIQFFCKSPKKASGCSPGLPKFRQKTASLCNIDTRAKLVHSAHIL